MIPKGIEDSIVASPSFEEKLLDVKNEIRLAMWSFVL